MVETWNANLPPRPVALVSSRLEGAEGSLVVLRGPTAELYVGWRQVRALQLNWREKGEGLTIQCRVYAACRLGPNVSRVAGWIGAYGRPALPRGNRLRPGARQAYGVGSITELASRNWQHRGVGSIAALAASRRWQHRRGGQLMDPVRFAKYRLGAQWDRPRAERTAPAASPTRSPVA